MNVFVVLIPVVNSLTDARKVCERLENRKFIVEGSSQATTMEVLEKIMEELNLDTSYYIEVETITDFMDRFNNEILEIDDYYMSYVYA